MQKGTTLGLDIGGTKLKSIAYDHASKKIVEKVVPSRASENPEAVRTAIQETVKAFQNDGIKYSHIGIGCAGSVDQAGGIVRNSPNFAKWLNIPLKNWVEEDFKVPVSIENDANCAVIAEWKAGNGIGLKNIVLLTLGTGIGGGLVLDGRLYRGSTGTGGELGHYSIHANGMECPCGNRGCFERYCSATSVKTKAGGISPRTVFEETDKSPVYKRIVSEFLEDFKVGLVSISNIFDPDVILVGGAVAEGVSRYLPELKDWVSKHAYPPIGNHVKLLPTKHRNLSGALGAAFLHEV